MVALIDVADLAQVMASSESGGDRTLSTAVIGLLTLGLTLVLLWFASRH